MGARKSVREPTKAALRFVGHADATPARVQHVRFGSVILETAQTAQEAERQRRKNVLEGQRAMGRAKGALASAGVTLKLAPGVPKYHVDSQGRLVRVLGRKREIGKLVDGVFQPIDKLP